MGPNGLGRVTVGSRWGHRQPAKCFESATRKGAGVTTSDLSDLGTSPAPWQDTTRSAAERAEMLLDAMTLEEKVGQLGSRWIGGENLEAGEPGEAGGEPPDAGIGGAGDLNVAPMQDVFAAAG